MKFIGKKRLVAAAGAATAVAAVATLIAGVTFGLFSASSTPSAANTFATGTVSVGSPTQTTCTITNMVPGDESVNYTPSIVGNNQSTKDIECSYAVTYTGSAPAFIGLSTSLTGTLGSALQWQISDGTNSYTTSGAINTNSASSPLYVATDAGNGVGGQQTYTFKVNYALPLNVTSQTLTDASLTLTVYAVQSGNNGTGVCTAGAQCANVTSWS